MADSSSNIINHKNADANAGGVGGSGSGGSGLLGKLLLPGYTDSGANNSFQPAAPQSQPIGAGSIQIHRHSSSLGEPLEASEAATEIRDNRSSVKQQFRLNASRNTTTIFQKPPSQSSVSPGQGMMGDSETRYAGFFPSTKPQQQQQQLSPKRPTSPPSVTRQQPLSQSGPSSTKATSVAGTSVVPQTGAFSFDTHSSDNRRLGNLEKENQTRFQFWESEGDYSRGEKPNTATSTSTTAGGSTSFTLNAANLQKVQEDDRAGRNSSPTDDSSSSNNNKGGPNRNTSLMNGDEDTGSDACLSTASEMGTVIETGNHAARMAEIDAMAALIEASPNVDSLTPRPESFPLAPSQTTQRRTAIEQDATNSLALPELDSSKANPMDNDKSAAAVVLPVARQTKAPPSIAVPSVSLEPEKVISPPTFTMANNPTASEMLTSALRRVGTGLNKAKASLSAPPTPRTPRVDDLWKSLSPRRNNHDHDLDTNKDLPASLALRSPGSSARFSLQKRSNHQQQQLQDEQGGPSSSSMSRPMLAPRFSPTGDTSRILNASLSFESTLHDHHHNYSRTRTVTAKTLPSSIPTLSSSSRPELLTTTTATEPLKLTSPFRLAQKCFSYDSTFDDDEDSDDRIKDTGSATSSHIMNLETSYPLNRRTEYQHRTLITQHTKKIQESASWDVGGSASGRGAFRAQPHRSYRIGGLRATESQLEHNAQRIRHHSDFSPRRFESTTSTTHTTTGSQTPSRHPHQQQNGITTSQKTAVLELQTPQRYMVDVEREDALDILACLVERGVTSWNEEPSNTKSVNESVESSSHTREALIATMTEEFRTSMKNSGDNDQGTKEKIAALEELLKSHAYALEMKRAALSASTWLKSIGRVPSDANDLDEEPQFVNGGQETSAGGQASGEDAKSDKQQLNPADETSSSSSFSTSSATDAKLALLTLKARLHSAESELRERTIMNEKLDEELCKCRAEIGRLSSTVSRHELSIQQTRSMFDDDADESNTVSTGVSVETGPPVTNKEDSSAPASPVAKELDPDPADENKMFDESFQGNNSLFQDDSMDEKNRSDQQSENLEILVLKTALEQANDTIRLLHEKLHKEKPEDERSVVPTVEIPERESGGSSSSASEKTKLAGKESSDEHRTINVRMLDGENFVTEWDDLTSPLPPPPDHGLRSPIVHAVLEQWTNDQGLHDSLLSWLERVMTGDNLEDSVPPLTISSLDHQVRDGFMMHVLPLLLRRADIHVAVQMRAHRQTTYDLAVSVNQKRPNQSGDPRSPSLLDQHAHEDWNDKKFDRLDSGSHSAVTVPVNNGDQNHGQGQEDAEYSHFDIPHATSHDMDDNPQSTFMGALGGALGGLLSRGKYTAVQSPSRFHSNASPPGFPPPPSIQATLDAASSASSSTSNPHQHSGPSGNRVVAELDRQPYHRVVSAPPGRIGITFVEYRGHAMVADMAPDSPLSSWVFPSDILIAVDEVPVSGMRVRDIIQILTKRKDRQRALRVISSHAMNEFTLNQSTLGDEAP